MDFWNTIGFIASALSAATYIPETIKAVKSRHLRDVAWGMLYLTFSSSTLWIIFAIRFNIIPIILSSSINLILSSGLIFLKYTFEQKNKKTAAAIANFTPGEISPPATPPKDYELKAIEEVD